MRRITTALLILVGILLAGSHCKRASQEEKSKLTIEPFEDVRSKNLSRADLSSRAGLIATLTFNQETVWPEQAKMPPGSDPKKILVDAMNPGLGVRELHQQGITGMGVNVAIIDQPLLPDHPEYDGKIVAFHDTGCGRKENGGRKSSMHGPAVASLLVGTNCGTAPSAKVYYAAVPSWKGDTAYEAKALDWIVQQNKKLPATQKIRVVSVSAAPTNPRVRDKNRHMWEPACARAEADGIMVIDCSRSHRGITSRCWYDLRDPENVGKCNPGAPDEEFRPELLDPAYIHVPASCRTTAQHDDPGLDSYIYFGRAGPSWTVPYCAGVLAMGWQIRPDLTPAQMKEMLFASAHVHKSGAKIINPKAFIDLIRKQSENQHTQKHPLPSSETLTIVPCVGVGDYTLGMSKDEVLKKLGEPKSIFWGGESFNLDNLPGRYFISYGDISFYLDENTVAGIASHSPRYKFANGLRVGDSEDKIKQAFGSDYELEEHERMDALTYEEKGLRFEIDKKSRMIEEIGIFQPEGSQSEESKVIMLSERPPGPITFPKIDRHPAATDFGRGALESLPRHNPKSTELWQVDLRGRDVSRFDLRKSLDDLLYADFDSRTTWPTADRMPEGFDHVRIMELGKNPGLGVRKMHERGIMGLGIGVAIVDMPLLTKHQEYADRLRLYEENNIEPESDDADMHGAAVASIAVGKTVGVAPEADLYYIGSWTHDRGKGEHGFGWNFTYYAQAVRRIIEINKQLSDDRKIRVISMSVGWSSDRKGYDEMTAAVEEAKKAGMFIVTSCIDDVYGLVFDGLDRAPLSDPDDFASYKPGLWLAEGFYRGQRKWNQLWVPMCSRTTAAPNGLDEYVFYRDGAWSWAIPYVAGLYALAAQVDPEITPERFWKLALKTGRTVEVEHQGRKYELGPIVVPGALIDALVDK